MGRHFYEPDVRHKKGDPPSDSVLQVGKFCSLPLHFLSPPLSYPFCGYFTLQPQMPIYK